MNTGLDLYFDCIFVTIQIGRKKSSLCGWGGAKYE